MFVKIRHWLIRKLAGNMPIIINFEFGGSTPSPGKGFIPQDGGDVFIEFPPDTDGALIHRCTFRGTGGPSYSYHYTADGKLMVELTGIGAEA